jgi:hypothetical protein|tara:strand:+ start:300 stop:407 length:108 start_codon:yes stop_codon:yes gene_type:complete
MIVDLESEKDYQVGSRQMAQIATQLAYEIALDPMP